MIFLIKNLLVNIFLNLKRWKNSTRQSYGAFEVNKLGILLMDYQTSTEEVYNEGILMKFSSETRQNDKIKYVRLNNDEKNGAFLIDGSSFKEKYQ